MTFAISDDNESRKAKLTAPFYGFRRAVDVENLLFEVGIEIFLTVTLGFVFHHYSLKL